MTTRNSDVTVKNLKPFPPTMVYYEGYSIDLNATQAYLRSGYLPRTAGQMGYENLRFNLLYNRRRRRGLRHRDYA